MEIFAFFQSLIFIKITILLILIGYAIFTVVIFSQIKILNRIISQSTSSLIEKLALIHIVLAISLFLIALVIL